MMFSITFNYRKSQYEALVRVVKQKDNFKKYRITIMNGELEVLLFGHHFFSEEDGKLDLSTTGLSDEIAELKTIIASTFLREIRTDINADKYSHVENGALTSVDDQE
jgi:hypothetical protein